jgi:hypothetical protein
MRRNNSSSNNNNKGHILTPTERLFYQRISIEGTQKIIDECWKIVKSSDEQEACKISALSIALEGQVQLCDMLKAFKQQYGVSSSSSSDNSNDVYGP